MAEKSKNKISIMAVIELVLIIFFTLVMTISLFGALGEVSVHSTDEACHGINAYEMAKSGDYVVWTLKGNVDYYNSKPPLLLWLMTISYKIFGYTPLGMRVPSAVAGLILFILGVTYCYKKWGSKEALLFAAYLPACTLMFNFHMFRTGDMDSLYTLFFALTMFFMSRAEKRPILNMIMVGIFGGLAFMTKGTHAFFIAATSVLFYPFIRKKVSIGHYFLSAGAALVVVAPWAIARYLRDGRMLFYALFVGETTDKVSNGKMALAYLNQLLSDPVSVMCIGVVLVGAITYCISNLKGKDINITKLLSDIVQNNKEVILMAIWFCVVVGGYTLSGQTNCWYIFSAYIPMGMLAIRAIIYLLGKFSSSRLTTVLSECILIAIVVACFVIAFNNIKGYPFGGKDGGSRNRQLLTAITEMKEQYPEEEWFGRAIYMEDSLNDYKPQNSWELDAVFYAETELGANCIEGGVYEFIQSTDEDALLILNDCLWEEYAGLLTGYVFLEMNNYYIMNKHRYGE